MGFNIEFSDTAIKFINNLYISDKKSCQLIYNKLKIFMAHPKSFGSELKGDRSGIWRYRVGNYRLLCKINTHIIYVLEIGHRKDIYE